MNCQWQTLMNVLPLWLRRELDIPEKEALQELRLRLHEPPELAGCTVKLSRRVTQEDLNFCIQSASRYSPWAASTAASGYLTIPGGHRMGLCGEVILREGQITGFRQVSSLCIRVARDFPGIASGLAGLSGSILILGAPGWGKTTLLRDLIRQRSNRHHHVCVVDEREELFPEEGFSPGAFTDILRGCPKSKGIDMVLRTMGPDCIALDEITADTDCQALVSAAWCGVSLLASAHAGSVTEFRSRKVYAPLWETGIFDHMVQLHSDKSWHLERGKP